ncbi:MAG: ADP-ribosylglycohydrolase family protein [Thermomicrobiales bacterium]
MGRDLLDRYRGVLVGGAVGDALGATVEFMDRQEIRDRYGVHREITGGGWLSLPAGEVTDDTQMALCIAESIVELERFDPADIAARFVDWYRSNPPDIGNTTRESLRQLDEGVPWHEAGEQTHRRLRPNDASNGSIMRCAPVSLLFRDDPDSNATASVDSSRITHGNPLAVDSCVALNAAVASLLADPHADILDVAIQAATEPDLVASLERTSSQTVDGIDASGYVLSTMQSAFWAVGRAGSFEDAIVTAVNLGQDADTTGAVAGALAGAKWGYSQIPGRWLDALRGHDHFVHLADRLHAISLARS